jgi:hypothetical protein
MIAFIDDHGAVYGVEPICDVLPIAPSTYHDHVAKRARRLTSFCSCLGHLEKWRLPSNHANLICGFTICGLGDDGTAGLF